MLHSSLDDLEIVTPNELLHIKRKIQSHILIALTNRYHMIVGRGLKFKFAALVDFACFIFGGLYRLFWYQKDVKDNIF